MPAHRAVAFGLGYDLAWLAGLSLKYQEIGCDRLAALPPSIGPDADAFVVAVVRLDHLPHAAQFENPPPCGKSSPSSVLSCAAAVVAASAAIELIGW